MRNIEWRVSGLTLAALIALTLMAVHPFLMGALPRSADGLLHLYRVIALDDAIRATGQLYPRYVPGLAYGYGAPLFNYYSPLAYYMPLLLHYLGLSYLNAWLAAVCVYTGVAVAGAYLMGRQWSGENRIGGLVTATAYIYAPYWLFDAVARGTLTEIAALALLPYLVWALTRLIENSTARNALVLIGCAAIFIPLHNILTLHAAFFLAAYGLWLWWQQGHRIKTLGWMGCAVLIAAAMTAFFWLPALGETGDVKIRAITESLNFIDVTRTLRPLSEVLALPHTAIANQLQQPIPITLSWLQIGLAFVAVLAALHRRLSRGLVTFLVAIVLMMVLLSVDTPLSVLVWRNIPLLDYTQFAWRTLGIASLALAGLAGLGALALIQWQQRLRPLVMAVVLAFIMLYSASWLYAIYVTPQANSIADIQNHERETGEVALSSYSEYLPTWTHPEALEPEKLRAAFAADQPIPRLMPPESVTIIAAQWQGTSAQIELKATHPATLVFDWLYVPGWQAHFINPASSVLPLAAEPSAEGFVSVEIPAGTHTLAIALYPTDLQATANSISAIAWAGFGIWLFGMVVYDSRSFSNLTGSSTAPKSPLAEFGARVNEWGSGSINHSIQAALLIGLALFACKLVVLDHANTIWRQDNAAIVNPQNGNFAGKILLLGAEIPDEAQSGANARFRLFWRLSGETLNQDFSNRIEMRDNNGTLIATGGAFLPGGLATSNWLAGYVIEDAIDFAIPPFTTPGVYQISVGLYDTVTQEHLSVINPDGNPAGVSVILGNLVVIRPSQPSVFDFAPLSDSGLINFAGVDEPLPASIRVGESLRFVPRWQAAMPPSQEIKFRLIWRCNSSAECGHRQVASSVMPLVANYPSSQWQQDDIWRGIHEIYVPGDLTSGEYALGLIVLDAEEQPIFEVDEIGRLQVIAPERNYSLPENIRPGAAYWENGIRLVGYELKMDTPGVSDLTLVWQTTAPLDKSLRLFVHLLNGERIIAQWDGIPADWTRPTTGWALDEVITTGHRFSIPVSEVAEIRIGWYDPNTSQRIVLDTGGDYLSIPPLNDTE